MNPLRLLAVESLLGKQYTYAMIAREVSKQFNVTERTARYDIDRVLARLNEEASHGRGRGNRKHALRESLRKLFRRSFDKEKYQVALGALCALAKLDGLNDPDALDIEAAVVQTPSDVAARTIQQATSGQLRELLKKYAEDDAE